MERQPYTLTIRADDQPGLLLQLAGLAENKRAEIKSFGVAQEGKPGVVLITVELLLTESEAARIKTKVSEYQ